MGIEQPLLEALFRYSPRPTLEEAIHCFEVLKVQDVAADVATAQRDLAIEFNTRRREIDKLPPLNHRDFLVGVVGVGIEPIPEHPDRHNWFAYAAWNTKPHPNQEKFCAERRVGRWALRRGCTCMVGLAVVGVLNTGGDGRSGKNGPGPTLDPCEVCRDDMRGEFNSLYRAYTPILTEHPQTKVRVVRPVLDFMHHHGEPWWEANSNVRLLRRGG
jgi:hypothetical protein